MVLALVATAVAFVLASILLTAARDHVPIAVVSVAILVVVLGVARVAGILYALPIGVVTILAFDWDYLLPLRDLDAPTVLLLGLFGSMSVIVAALTVHSGRRAVASEQARAALADKQAALRRVATLVAKATPPDQVFTAVTTEVGRVLHADQVRMYRYDGDGAQRLLSQ